MQSLFADVVAAEAQKRLKRIPFVGISQSTKVDKDFRIRTAVEPVINHGRLFILEKNIDLAVIMINSGVPLESVYHLTRALSHVTNIGQRSMTYLKREGFLE